MLRRESTVEGGASARPTAAELGGVGVDDALRSVREPLGVYNWLLVAPDCAFVNAGSLSVLELLRWLEPDAVYFGLLRMGFGSRRFRRTKWIGFIWSGPRAGAMKSAQIMRARTLVKGRLGPTSVEIEATDLAGLSLEEVIEKVRRASVIDDIEEGDSFSAEGFMAALHEEAAAASSFFGDDGKAVVAAAAAAAAPAPTPKASSPEAPLPEGWTACEAEGARRYYVNAATGESQWERPTEPAFLPLPDGWSSATTEPNPNPMEPAILAPAPAAPDAAPAPAPAAAAPSSAPAAAAPSSAPAAAADAAPAPAVRNVHRCNTVNRAVHPLVLIEGVPPGYRAAAQCNVCKREPCLPRVHHCATCRYDECEACFAAGPSNRAEDVKSIIARGADLNKKNCVSSI